MLIFWRTGNRPYYFRLWLTKCGFFSNFQMFFQESHWSIFKYSSLQSLICTASHALELLFLNEAAGIIVHNGERLLHLCWTLLGQTTDLKEFLGAEGIWSWKYKDIQQWFQEQETRSSDQFWTKQSWLCVDGWFFIFKFLYIDKISCWFIIKMRLHVGPICVVLKMTEYYDQWIKAIPWQSLIALSMASAERMDERDILNL